MERLYEQILDITKAAFRKEHYEPKEEVNWNDILRGLDGGLLAGVAMKAITPKSFKDDDEKKLFSAWSNYTLSRALKQMTAVRALYDIVNKAKEEGIDAVVFKGVTVATLYPEPYMRFSSDADLYISEDKRSEMENLLKAMGYVLCEESSKEHVPHYVGTGKNRYLSIDLHDRLWEDFEGKQAKILDSLKLTDPKKITEIKACGIELKSLGYTDHLIFLVFHAVKHLATEGLPLRFVTDIALFSEHYSEKIEWKRFWEAMKELSYDMFYATMIEGAQSYLDMAKNVKIPDDVSRGDVNKLFTAMVAYGCGKDDNMEKYYSVEFVSQYLMRENVKKSSKLQNFKTRFFPSPKELKNRYGYAKKCPILLPIAWGHRFVSAAVFSAISRAKGVEAMDVLRKADHTIDMMNEYGLFGTKQSKENKTAADTLVSVVIPTYATNDSLRRAVDCILAQTHKKLDIIVVDDNKADSDYRKKAEEIMESYKDNAKVRYIKNKENLGGSGARNVGIEAANGEYIAFLDDDDWYYPEKIEKQLDVFLNTEFKNLAMVYCDVEYEDGNGAITYVERKRMRGNCLYNALAGDCVAATSQWLTKKSLLQSVGNFTIVPNKQDSTLILKLLKAGYEIDYVPEILSKYHNAAGEVRISFGKRKIEGELLYAEKIRDCYDRFSPGQIKKIEYSIAKRLYILWGYKGSEGTEECKKYLDIMRKNRFFATEKYLLKEKLKKVKRSLLKR